MPDDGFGLAGLIPPHGRMHGIAAFQKMPGNLAAALAMAGTLAAGVAGGFLARLLHLPLPWLLGSLATVMALSLAGAPVRLPETAPRNLVARDGRFRSPAGR